MRRSLIAIGTLTGVIVLSVWGFAGTAAYARYATGGAGLHLGAIDWFDWGTPDLEIFDGMTRTNTRTIGGSVLETTCTLTGEVGDVRTYRPGQWQGDSLDDLYNVGGTGDDNQLISGLYNWVDGTLVGFDISCTVTLDGMPAEIQGLVVADAEASNDYPGTAELDEYIEATPHQPAVWRVIDRYRNCETSVVAQLAANGTLRLGPDEVECTYRTEDGSGPMAVAFMEGATSATVSLQGGGRSAVAVGVVLEADFGDAPSGYEAAGAVYDRGWQGGAIPLGSTDISSTDFPLAIPAMPSSMLGSAIDPEGEPASSADAAGDDLAGTDDEDGVGALVPATALPGSVYTIAVTCQGTGHVAGWVDWNLDSAFGAGEKSNEAVCSSGSVHLSWTLPADVVSGDTFVRLRIAPDAARLVPVGVRFGGEVEDHALRIDPVPAVWSLAKSATVSGSPAAGGLVHPGDVITYAVTASNTGSADVPDVVITDDLTGVLDDAAFLSGSGALTVGSGAPAAVPDPVTGAGSASLVTPAFTLPAGQTAMLTYQVTVGADSWLRTLTNTVTAVGGPDGSMPPEDCYPGQDPLAPSCATTHITNPAIGIEKIGESDGSAWVRMDGSSFLVLADDGGAPGAPLADLPVTETGVGAFEVVDVPPGTYWLTEIAAPAGFSLLAEPVRFAVGSDGTVSVGSTDGVVTASGSLLTVRDVPAFVLPRAGGAGTDAYSLAGTGLLAVAAGIAAFRRWRRDRGMRIT